MLRLFAAGSLLAISAMLGAQTTPAKPDAAIPATAGQAAPEPGKAGTQQQTAAAQPAKPDPAQVNAKITAPLAADQAALKAHVMFLASDAMRGREAGSPEFDIAAQYVAAQFYAAGLKPGGDQGGYLQHVPLVSYKAADKGAMRWTPRGQAPVDLVFGEDYVPSANPLSAATSLSKPVVFVGRGIVAPQYKVDDYKGVDVRGRIVAVLGGAPAGFGGEERAYFGSAGTKAAIARRLGAAGMVFIDTPGPRARPFATLVRGMDTARMTWARPDGTGSTPEEGAPVLGTISQAGAAKLFGAKGWAKVQPRLGDPDARFKPFALGGALSAETRTSFTPASSENVVGLLPGSDPTLGAQVVVLSAHLDHIGVSKPAEGDAPGKDRINNGALDNAIGIASLIEEAKRFTASGTAPKRTLMFLAVTGEEKGLVGSDYFAHQPTVPAKSIVADVNLDMPILTYRFEDMIVYGADRSTLGPIVRRAVNAAGVDLSPDPAPEEGIFVRSDHFRFVQQGIPSVFLWPGQKGPGKAGFAEFMGKCYHRPCDELATLNIDWSQGPRFVDVNYRIAKEIADGAEAPVWNKGDYFGTTYKGPMQK
ncbi:PA domain-containing protein [Sphingomonas gellani]|uniref:PA domain-containing protein n=1 Tax=Sphingomonas gellani TaxID=1166340 RepID=A0A1H8AHV5_9SPHN|nr:M28 family metallopeptidase [Sphingomonas gellani]SEM70201.1 PA domain-containing protein [Sphingomonas gellani]